MARALVLRDLQTRFLGLQSVSTGEARQVVVDGGNRVLRVAWLSIANTAVLAIYGTIMARLGTVGESNDGIFLAEGWFGGAANVTGDDAALHAEGIAWYGELPLFESRSIRLIFTVRNDTGSLVTYTGGYAWQEFEENDRPS